MPFLSILFLKTHLVQITLWFEGIGTNSHTSLLSNWFNSYCIAIIQFSSSKASFIFLGSIWEIKARLLQMFVREDLVLTPLDGLPIIWSCRWLMTNFHSLWRSWVDSSYTFWWEGSANGDPSFLGSFPFSSCYLLFSIWNLSMEVSKPKSSSTLSLSWRKLLDS